MSISVTRRCQLLGIHRSAAYNKCTIPEVSTLEREDQVKRRIDYWHTMMPYLGTRKLKEKLRDEDKLDVGRKLIRRYMSEMGIRAIYPKPNLSKPAKEQHQQPYLLKNKAIFLPNQVWAVDITYIPLRHGHMYLTTVIDWYSRYIVGWALADTLETASVMHALFTAMERHGIPAIINSDQGSQFTSTDYRQLLKERGIRQSMDGKARWVDNVVIERWFRSLKVECIYINEYNSPRELRDGISKYISEYNQLRPHQSLDYKTPEMVYMNPFMVKAVG